MKKAGIGIVGTGSRGTKGMGRLLLDDPFKDQAALVALCDINDVRLQLAREQLGGDVPTFQDYDAFLATPGLDGVIVTTPCYTHADLVVKALEAGKCVLCEKAMALSAEDGGRILEAEKRSGNIVTVGLCLRHSAFMQGLIPVLRRGDIGEVVLVSAVETLEGSDHFARWHRKKEYSGGMMLQKGTHTLDLINWIVDEDPIAVSGFGGRDVYRPREDCRGRRCLDCPERETCPEFLDMASDPDLMARYRKAEHIDGYIFDRCAFDPEADIIDNATVTVNYPGGKRATYTFCLFYGVEGIERKFTILGTKGKIDVSRRREEFTVYERRTQNVTQYRREGQGEGLRGEVQDFIDSMVYGKKPLADSRAGLWSMLAGLAAEEAISEERVVKITPPTLT